MKDFRYTKRLRNVLLGLVIAAAGIGLFWGLAQLGIGIPCLFFRLTGYQCPGCGNSRAALALLRLDFAAAFQFNPLCFLEFFYIAWVLFHCVRRYLKGGTFSYPHSFLWLDLPVLVAVLLWWPLRNFL